MDNAEGNILYIKDNKIQLMGFNSLKQIATFCFLPSGITITFKETSASHCFTINITDEKIITNENLLQMLLDRNLSEKNWFVYLDGYYYEVEPHPENI